MRKRMTKAKLKKMYRLNAAGESKSAIAVALKTTFKTVHKYLTRIEAQAPASKPRTGGMPYLVMTAQGVTQNNLSSAEARELLTKHSAHAPKLYRRVNIKFSTRVTIEE